MTTAPIDLLAAWQAHQAEVLEDREPRRISASDLHGCERAFHDRYNGNPQLPYTPSSFSAFERGFAYEPRFFDAFSKEAEAQGLRLVWDRDRKISLDGIEGHPDFLLYEDETLVAVIDPTTTASKFTNWGYGHALKSAWYAMAMECNLFAEVVVCIGFGGNILSLTPHWFSLDEPCPGGGTWREAAQAAAASIKAVAASDEVPYPSPPLDPLTGSQEAWRCGKPGSGVSYCRAQCERNAHLMPLTGKAAEKAYPL